MVPIPRPVSYEEIAQLIREKLENFNRVKESPARNNSEGFELQIDALNSLYTCLNMHRKRLVELTTIYEVWKRFFQHVINTSERLKQEASDRFVGLLSEIPPSLYAGLGRKTSNTVNLIDTVMEYFRGQIL